MIPCAKLYNSTKFESSRSPLSVVRNVPACRHTYFAYNYLSLAFENPRFSEKVVYCVKIQHFSSTFSLTFWHIN